jgi:hypothetical protein
MPVHRRNARGSVSAMFNHRMGGRVTLFNYNPSIAGGKIGVKRFHTAHHKGRILRANRQKGMTAIQGAEGSGLACGQGVTGGVMAASPVSSTHGDRASKKRVFDAIAEHLGGGKRSRR